MCSSSHTKMGTLTMMYLCLFSLRLLCKYSHSLCREQTVNVLNVQQNQTGLNEKARQDDHLTDS